MRGKFRLSAGKLSIILIFCGTIFLLAGCWDHHEIDELAIVTSAAIDKEDDKVKLSLGIFIPKNGTGQTEQGSGGSGNEMTFTTSHTGSNLADALSKLQAEMPRKVFWGSCKIFIISDKVAKEGVSDHLDFLLRHPGPRERAFIFVGEGEAKKYIELKTDLERYSSEEVRKLAGMDHGTGLTIMEMDKMLEGSDRALTMPYLKRGKDGNGNGKSATADIAGTAFFKGDRMHGVISESSTRGLLWIKNRMKEYTISMKPEGEKGEVTLYPITSRIKMEPTISGDDWKMNVHVKAEGTVVQNTTSLDLSNPDSQKKIEKELRKAIKNNIEKVIREAQNMRIDGVHYGQEFHRKYPRQWEKVEASWEEKFPEVRTEFHIQTNIRREGYIKETKSRMKQGE